MSGPSIFIPNFRGLSVGEAQRACVLPLKSAGIDTPVVETRVLLGFVLGGGSERVLADRDETLTVAQGAALAEALHKRCQRVPMAQIVGTREFWSLAFKVTPATLIPRPDSETIVAAALEHAAAPVRTILDLGTGTGCLALALLSEWPHAHGTAVDASADALAVAAQNADALGMSERVTMVQADWTKPEWMNALHAPFDVIVSNPPYIPSQDIESLEPDVRAHEPRAALDGGDTGLDAYRRLAPCAATLLRPGGIVVFEVGIGQVADVAALLRDTGLTVLHEQADLGGVLRAVVARKP